MKPGVDQADLWEDLTAMRVLICGGRHFEDAAVVEIELSSIHAKTPISVMIHGGLPGIGFPAEAWARRNNVHVIRYPANFSLGKSGDSNRDLFMLEDSRPQTLLVFPGGRRTSELLREVGWRGLCVIEVQAIEPGLQAARSLPPGATLPRSRSRSGSLILQIAGIIADTSSAAVSDSASAGAPVIVIAPTA